MEGYLSMLGYSSLLDGLSSAEAEVFCFSYLGAVSNSSMPESVMVTCSRSFGRNCRAAYQSNCVK